MKGDFTGFSFDGIHSSQLNIVHVSSSDRYSEELFPEVKDKTIEIPNNHGEYYYGSTYGTRTFEIDIAFDSVTETQFRKIRQLFSTTKICELIFDERPYKVYYAKAESPVELSYICFDEEEYTWDTTGHRSKEKDPDTGQYQPGDYIPGSIDHKVYTGNKRRIYKGEGTINLICHFPLARQLYKIKELYSNPNFNPNDGVHSYTGNTITSYTNVDEWIESSGILDYNTRHNNSIDEVKTPSNTYRYMIPVYNPGDLNVGFCLYIPFNSEGKICANEGKNVIIINGDDAILYLNKEITRQKPIETGILINTTNHLIEGVVYRHITQLQDTRNPSWITTGSIYNQYIVAGDFPHIIKSDWFFDGPTGETKQAIYIDCAQIEESQSTQNTEAGSEESSESTQTDNVTEGVMPNIDIYYNYLYF